MRAYINRNDFRSRLYSSGMSDFGKWVGCYRLNRVHKVRQGIYFLVFERYLGLIIIDYVLLCGRGSGLYSKIPTGRHNKITLTYNWPVGLVVELEHVRIRAILESICTGKWI